MEEKEAADKVADLKGRLHALAQIIVAFGEYVFAQERTYLSALIKHIRQLAPGSELVPLDALPRAWGGTLVCRRNGVGRGRVAGRRRRCETLGIEPPSSIAQLRQDLHDEREKNADYQRLEVTKHQYELVHAKFMGVEARLTDSMAREEAFDAKFAALSES